MKILGLMSGTSGDGIDGVNVNFDENGILKILWHKSFSYSSNTVKRINGLIRNASAHDITLGHSYISELYFLACKSFFKDEIELPDYIAAHGQTVWHEPDVTVWEKIPLRNTLQLLDAQLLSYKLNLPVIYDFRRADMAVGGQGAPLVPFADKKIFGQFCQNNRNFIVLNIGGISNITVLYRSEQNVDVDIAFDAGPGNVLMDEFMQIKHLGQYDKDGIIASHGKTNKILLNELLNDRYFLKKPPKSTGREYFNLNRYFSKFKDMTDSDVMSTLMDFTINSIECACQKYLVSTNILCVAGGGALNNELMKRLAISFKKYNISVVKSDYFGIPVMSREALAFSILGKAYLNKEPSNIPKATGAKKEVVLGSMVNLGV